MFHVLCFMKIHFIGIGGIGVSALAQYYLSKGNIISGSDLTASEITDFLKSKGTEIIIGHHSQKNITKGIDLVVFSPAVQTDNPEYKRAEELGIKLQSYPEALGQLTKSHFTIAVSGTHGKSTTTATIALVLTKAGLDPTVIIGTKIKEFGNTNFRYGKSKILVIEADEHFASFLNYWPKIIVLTNIERDHLDYYKNLKNVLNAYRKYISHLPKNGILVANKDDKNINKIINFQFPISNKFSIKQFSIQQKESAKLKKILKIPGQHNVYNALAALEVARILNIPDGISLKALSEYRGSWRRFDTKKGKAGNKKITVVSDYGHHPTEVFVTLKAAREKYYKKTIWCIFQPHQHQRTYYLFNDFVKVFREVPIDNVIITDIYDVAGREKKKISKSTNSKNLVKKINLKKVKYLSVSDAEKFVKENIKNGDALIIMGAGDIYKLVDKF